MYDAVVGIKVCLVFLCGIEIVNVSSSGFEVISVYPALYKRLDRKVCSHNRCYACAVNYQLCSLFEDSLVSQVIAFYSYDSVIILYKKRAKSYTLFDLDSCLFHISQLPLRKKPSV